MTGTTMERNWNLVILEWDTQIEWKKDSSHGGQDYGSVPGMPLHRHLWAAFAYVWRPAYPMILCYYPNPTPSMWPPALSSLCFLFLRPLTYFLLHLSLYPFLSFFSPLCLNPLFALISLLPFSISLSSFSLPNTARGWASATSMKTDDSVLFFLLPTAADPLQEGSVCLEGEGEMRRID